MLTFQELTALSRRMRDDRVLSVYLDGTSLDPASKTPWRVPLDNALKDIRRWLEGSTHNERMGFERCVRLLEGELAEFRGAIGSPGWAGFITVAGVLDSERLPVPTPTIAIWSTGICVAPYIRALKQTRPVVVVVADARKARIFRYATGVLAPAETVHAHAVTEPPVHMGDAPRLGFHSGTRGTTGHDAAQHALHAGTKRMIDGVARRSAELAGHDGWILTGGIPEVSAHMAAAMEKVAPHRVLRMEELDIHATEAQVTAAAQRGASQLRDETDMRHVSEIAGAADDERLIARGPSATRQALEQATVRELYLTSRFLQDHLADAEDAVRAAIAQGATVEEVSRAVADRLDEFGGMGARLRYPVPTVEAAEPASSL
jgi:hypothetical protein